MSALTPDVMDTPHDELPVVEPTYEKAHLNKVANILCPNFVV